MKVFKELYGKVNPKTEYADSAYTDEIRLKSDGVGANIPVNTRNGGKRMSYDVEGYG